MLFQLDNLLQGNQPEGFKMKIFYFSLLRYFRAPSVRVESNKMLEQARRDLLANQSRVDYYQAMVDFNLKTIQRLSE
jgi:hypothetical protein